MDEFIAKKGLISQGDITSTGIISAGSGTSDDWSSTNTTVDESSGNWDAAYVAVSGLDLTTADTLTISNPPENYTATSADISGNLDGIDNSALTWNNTTTTVNSNSAAWSDVSFDSSEIQAASGGWNSTETTVNANSAQWTLGGDLSEIQAASGDWNSTYTTVDENSGNWDSAYMTVSGASFDPADAINIDFTPSNYTATTADVSGHLDGIDTKASDWNSTYTSVSTTSGNWDEAYTVINGASYNTGDTLEIGFSATNYTYTDELSGHLDGVDKKLAALVTMMDFLTANWESTYTTVNTNSGSW